VNAISRDVTDPAALRRSDHVPLAADELSYVEEQLRPLHIPVVREDKYPAGLLHDEEPV